MSSVEEEDILDDISRSASPLEEIAQGKRDGIGFGNRKLLDNRLVFTHNSWDKVEWDEEQLQLAKEIVEGHKRKEEAHSHGSRKHGRDHDSVDEREVGSGQDWDKFYHHNEGNFFKDRHWFEHEFEELFESNRELTLLEVGCGAGNSIFPLLEQSAGKSKGLNLFIYGCDFSSVAIDLVRKDSRYNESKCHVFVHDISKPFPKLTEEGIKEKSVDMALMVFVLSALPRDRMSIAIQKIKEILKPGGLLFFRDYGLYDLAQLRLKPKNWIEGNQYRRGDGTLMYFFTMEEVEQLFGEFQFVKKDLHEDRRLLVNRKRQLLMYRVWTQGVFQLKAEEHFEEVSSHEDKKFKKEV